MPSAPTPIFLIPGPDLDDGPADIELAFDPMRNRIEELLKSLAALPVGSELAYCGGILPQAVAGAVLGDVEYAWADGGLINRTFYAAFAALVQDAYNGGAAPGTGTPTQGSGGSGPLIRLPDKRGRVMQGADNFGQGAAGRMVNTAARAPGQSGGFDALALTVGQIPSHAHGYSLSAVAIANHSHGGATAPMNQNNVHSHSLSGGVPIYNTSYGGAGQSTTPGGAYGLPRQALGADAVDINHAHGIGADGGHGHTISGSITAIGSDQVHSNMSPYEVDRVIVRIR